MKKKRILILGVVIVVAVVGYILFDQWRTTTYGEVLNHFISEDEEIREIYIQIMNRDPIQEIEMKLNNSDEMTNLTKQLSNMKLKKTRWRYYETTIYYINIKTNQKELFIGMDDNYILNIDRQYYKIAGDNELVDLIESYGVKWEIRER